MANLSDDIQLIRDFYLVLIGLVISYFIGITVNFNNVASPVVLLKLGANYLLGEGTPPPTDSVIRSIGVTVVPIGSIFLYGFIWRAYKHLLEGIGSKREISLWIELPQVLFLGVVPIGFLLLFSPGIQLTDYPIASSFERYAGGVFSTVVLVAFWLRLRVS